MTTGDLNTKFAFGILETIANDGLGARSDAVLDAGIVAYVRAVASGSDGESALKSATATMVAKSKEVA